MTGVDFVLLYVENPAASASFYADLLGRPPIEASPTFAMFAMPSEIMLGLWARDTVEPKPGNDNGGSELAFSVADDTAVDNTHADWRQRGFTIAQAPTAMDFGRTCVAVDPDGHRLRVFGPTAS